MKQKFKKLLLAGLSSFSLMVLLRGCGDINDFTPQAAEEFLERRYGVDFTLTETVEETQTTTDPNYTGTRQVHNPKCYYFVDENDVPCEFNMVFNYGCQNEYNIIENYPVQWLKYHSDLYRELTEMKKKDISWDDRFGIHVKIRDVDEIEPVCRTVFNILRKDEAVFPENDNTDEDFSINPPSFSFDTADDLNLRRIELRTKRNDRLTDEDIFIQGLKKEFYEKIGKDKTAKEIFPSELDIMCKGEKISEFKEISSLVYSTEDVIKKDGRLNPENFINVCKAAGLKVDKWNANKIVVKSGNNKVEIKRSKNLSSDGCMLSILLNGNPYTPEDDHETLRVTVNEKTVIYPKLCLTPADYYYLFGIKFNYDFDKQTAEISGIS